VNLPAVWAAIGHPERAEALAQAITDPGRRTAALTGLAWAAADAGDLGRATPTRMAPDAEAPKHAAQRQEQGRQGRQAAQAISYRDRQDQALVQQVWVAEAAGDLGQAEAAALATDLYDPRLKIQVNIGAGWGADFPSPSAFFGPLLSCQSADEPGTNNFARFCDPHVDTLTSQAQAAQLTDPAAARKLWAQADRIVTDQAPYVPVLNAGMAGFVSSRAGNYQASPVYGPLLDQMWIR
jgi:hypothetical protein